MTDYDLYMIIPELELVDRMIKGELDLPTVPMPEGIEKDCAE